MKIPWWLCLLAVFSSSLLTGGVIWRWKPDVRAVGEVAEFGSSTFFSGGGENQAGVAAQERAVDVRALLASPQEFLDSLRGESSLRATSRIMAVLADLPLAAVRELAMQLKKGVASGDNKGWLLVSAVMERWAELDADELLGYVRNGELGLMNSYHGVNAAFSQLAKRDPEQAWKLAQDIGPDSYDAKSAVLMELGSQEPERVLAMIRETALSVNEVWMVRSALEMWMEKDPASAARTIEQMPPSELRTGLLEGVASAYARQDIDAALTWSHGLKNLAERQQALGSVLGLMAQEDPQRVLALALQPEYGVHRRQVLVTAMTAWARKDFDAAFAYAIGSKSPADQQEMLTALNRQATPSQRQRLLEIADTLPPMVARQVYISSMQDSWGGSALDPIAVIDSISSTSVREDVLKQILGRSWGFTVEQAKEIFSRLQPTSQTPDQVASIAWRMSRQNPEEAMQWAESLEASDLRKSAVNSVLRNLAQIDPEIAAQKAIALTEPQQRQEALREVVHAWAGGNEKAALAWAQTLSGADRVAALGALSSRIADTNPEEAVAIFSEFAASLPSEAASAGENKQVARSLAHSLTENDPQQAIAWVQGLAEGPLRDEALAGVAAKWASYDARATSEWIAHLPAGEGRDAAAQELVGVIARDDPESAWQWALSIGDRVRRKQAASQVLSAWKAHGNAEAARTVLGQGGFAEEDVQELVRALE